MSEATATLPAAVVQHRGRILQVHVAPWDRDGGNHEVRDKQGDLVHPLHLHVQDLDGGAGRVVPLDDPLARELSRHHQAVRDLGAELPEDAEARRQADERQAQLRSAAQAREREAREEARRRAEFQAYRESQAAAEREKEEAEFQAWKASQGTAPS
jgi:hypothetical protein